MGKCRKGGGGGVIAFLIFHYSVSTEKGWLEDKAGCSEIIWFTQVAISQWFIIRLLKGLEEECLG